MPAILRGGKKRFFVMVHHVFWIEAASPRRVSKIILGRCSLFFARPERHAFFGQTSEV
jgi:hypothetical protein